MPITGREFQEAGFLQEANRLFFHPHGLALEMARVREGQVHVLALTAEQHDRLLALAGDDEELLGVARDATCYVEGDVYLSGIRDARDDPEGIVFVEGGPQRAERAATVAAAREHHREAREALFGGSDVQPVVSGIGDVVE